LARFFAEIGGGRGGDHTTLRHTMSTHPCDPMMTTTTTTTKRTRRGHRGGDPNRPSRLRRRAERAALPARALAPAPAPRHTASPPRSRTAEAAAEITRRINVGRIAKRRRHPAPSLRDSIAHLETLLAAAKKRLADEERRWGDTATPPPSPKGWTRDDLLARALPPVLYSKLI